MIPAHALFSKAANSAFKDYPTLAGRIRHHVDGIIETRQFSLQSTLFPTITVASGNEMSVCQQNEDGDFNLDHILIGYRYRYASNHTEIEEHRKFANDVALLPFEEKEEAEKMQCTLYNHELRCTEIKRTSSADLQRYHEERARIEVKGLKGRLDHTMKIEKFQSDCKGFLLIFTLNNEKDEKTE